MNMEYVSPNVAAVTIEADETAGSQIIQILFVLLLLAASKAAQTVM